MIQKIFLDMDGVMADFVQGMCNRHHRLHPWLHNPDLQEQDLQRVWGGMSQEVFWSVTDFEFWSTLPKAPFADEIVQASIDLVGVENVAILSAPTYHCPGCVPGKFAWLDRLYPQISWHAVFTKAKEFIARPGVLLVDDFKSNLDKFAAAGGSVLQCPAPHNERRSDMRNFSYSLELARLSAGARP